jgi:hypothetical protein
MEDHFHPPSLYKHFVETSTRVAKNLRIFLFNRDFFNHGNIPNPYLEPGTIHLHGIHDG